MRPVISLHCWIELEEKVLDLKLRMWTDESAPEGLFKPKDEGFYYKRLDIMQKPSKVVYDILVVANKTDF